MKSAIFSAIASISPPSNLLPITSTLARNRKPKIAIADLVGLIDETKSNIYILSIKSSKLY